MVIITNMPIPKQIRQELQNDKRMEKCEICGKPTQEFHHVFIYAGKQIQDAFNIASACKKHHEQATPHNNKYKQEIREQFEWNALQRMTDENIAKYWKKDWGLFVNYLSKKASEYGW